jgi:phosphoesterase RecJ-like protein
MTILNSIEELREVTLTELSKHNSVALLTHSEPDGDGLSSCFALQEILKSLSIKSDVVTNETTPSLLSYLEPEKRITPYSEELSYSLLIIVDCHAAGRVGVPLSLINKAKCIIVIDHHNIVDPIDSYLYNDPKSVSVGSIIYYLFKEEIENLPEETKPYVAEALYTTVLNDTNRFENRNTDADVFALCEKLARLNISPAEISKKFMQSYPPEYYRFVGQALSTLKTFEDNKVLFFHSTTSMLNENKLDNSDTSKMTNWIANAKDNEVLVYFREVEHNTYRLSFRSKRIDVNQVAKEFGGGGHSLASGCTIEGILSEIEQLVLQKLRPLI